MVSAVPVSVKKCKKGLSGHMYAFWYVEEPVLLLEISKRNEALEIQVMQVLFILRRSRFV